MNDILSSIAIQRTISRMTNYKGSLAEYVMAMRGMIGISQEELARRAGSGVTKQDISAIERGRVMLPSVEKRRALVRALNGFHAELLVNAGEISPEEIVEGANIYDPKRAEAVSPFPAGSLAARVVDLMKDLGEEDIAHVYGAADYAHRMSTGARRGTNAKVGRTA